MKRNSQKKREIITLVAVFIGVLVISALAVYLLSARRTAPVQTTAQIDRPTSTAQSSPDQRASDSGNESFVDRLFGTRNSDAVLTNERWEENVGTISLRLLLAALLGAGLAFRPRKRILALKHN